MNTIILTLIVLLSFSGFTLSDSFAIVSPYSAFTLEGSGYAVTSDTIKISNIDLTLSTQQQTGSSVKSSINDGFITLDAEKFLTTKLQTTLLRQGQYIRADGIAENDSGNQISVKLFGRLIEESKNASIYGFTGRIAINDNNYKIIYTAKLSELTKINISPTESKTDQKIIIHILRGASTQGVGSTIGQYSSSQGLDFKSFSQDRISIVPGTTITFVNNDTVSHNIQSGRDTGDRYNRFVADDQISTGDILPGQSVDITFDNAGFYRLFEPNYQWMNLIAFVFPNVDNNVSIGTTQNPKN
ncbi:MAG TPA: plastocyanin/azurin family copper-binding protein [Nitrosarchaeum sp.]|nr:plastocyanin/azurin family copper-binding protein [Nitrosarchaeum sp.]